MIEFILRSGIAKRIAIGTVVLVIGYSVWTPITLILSARTYANHVMTTSFATWDPTYQRGYFFAYVEVGNAAVPLDARFDNAVIKERE